jgi:hypothetical protein
MGGGVGPVTNNWWVGARKIMIGSKA